MAIKPNKKHIEKLKSKNPSFWIQQQEIRLLFRSRAC